MTRAGTIAKNAMGRSKMESVKSVGMCKLHMKICSPVQAISHMTGGERRALVGMTNNVSFVFCNSEYTYNALHGLPQREDW